MFQLNDVDPKEVYIISCINVETFDNIHKILCDIRVKYGKTSIITKLYSDTMFSIRGAHTLICTEHHYTQLLLQAAIIL